VFLFFRLFLLLLLLYFLRIFLNHRTRLHASFQRMNSFYLKNQGRVTVIIGLSSRLVHILTICTLLRTQMGQSSDVHRCNQRMQQALEPCKSILGRNPCIRFPLELRALRTNLWTL
jgi:hypothetical protein